ncbi:MAG: ion transporter [Bacteroidota bacterium]|nr:ion transporter [Bacteroidota bacterium]MDE2834108.1 ion transporter [Bacteroidota bacterium]MDE2955969.1 ion transporter [Bacteroidota bacterium]
MQRQAEHRIGIGHRLVRDSVVLTVIVINAIVLFLAEFPGLHAIYGPELNWVDYGCLLFFILEAGLKIRFAGSFGRYWKNPFNGFDFVIVALSLPLLVSPFLQGAWDEWGLFMLLRVGRLFRFARLMRFIPDAERILGDIWRALRASVCIFLALIVLNLVLAMGATLLFGHVPIAEEFFGDPFRSMYSLFKVFTIEGWYEIPDRLANAGASQGFVLGLRIYFTIAVTCGGLLGLSIANAVFVDAMVADNNNELLEEVRKLQAQVQGLRRDGQGPGTP